VQSLAEILNFVTVQVNNLFQCIVSTNTFTHNLIIITHNPYVHAVAVFVECVGNGLFLCEFSHGS